MYLKDVFSFHSKLLTQLRETSNDLKKSQRKEKRVREDLRDLVKTLYLTLKIEELSLKNARSMLELITDRLKPSDDSDMEL